MKKEVTNTRIINIKKGNEKVNQKLISNTANEIS